MNIANQYINFQVEGKQVKIPYCIVEQLGEKKYSYTMGRTDRYRNYAGKGTPEEIKKALYDSARKKSFDLKKGQSDEISRFMIKEGIGIDCSGFVYNILDSYLRQTKNISLDQLILRYYGVFGLLERLILKKNRVRRSSAATLTNSLNTIKIEKAKDAKPGDMIRLTHVNWKGKHIVIIVSVNKTSIRYVNASEYTKIQGPHFGKIQIIDPDKGLEYQNWLEILRNGKNYGKEVFDPKRGDSLRRLKYLVE